EESGYTSNADDVFPAIERLRIPVEYLANLLSAGDAEVVRQVLRRLAAMRSYMRRLELRGQRDAALARSVGLEMDDLEDMYRLLAIAKYEERYVIPPAHAELGRELMEQQGACGLDFDGGPGNCGAVAPRTNERFMLKKLPLLDGGGKSA
ncbi:MAG: nitrate reductase subunit beta, partial [Gaiellaceae bacterium]